jgi:hypothetical protein
MTQLPTEPDEKMVDELLKRLTATRSTSTFPQYEPDAPKVLINPDGIKAAETIIRLQSELTAANALAESANSIAEAALSQYSGNPRPSPAIKN